MNKVKQPNHYTNGNKEVRRAMEDNFSYSEVLGYYKGNIAKYICRYELKNGLEDIQKAQTYFEFLLEYGEIDSNEIFGSDLVFDIMSDLQSTQDFTNDKDYLTFLKNFTIMNLCIIDTFCLEEYEREIVTVALCIDIMIDLLEEPLTLDGEELEELIKTYQVLNLLMTPRKSEPTGPVINRSDDND